MKLLLTCLANLSSLSGRTTNAAGTGATAAGLLLPITGGGQGAAMQRKTFAALQRLPESSSSTDKLYIENACESTHSDLANGAYRNNAAVERVVHFRLCNVVVSTRERCVRSQSVFPSLFLFLSPSFHDTP